MVQCEKHGLKGIELLCPHLDESQKNMNVIEIIPINDELFDTIWLCRKCAELYNQLKEENDDKLDEIYHSLKPCCESCFEEWKESQRNGND